MVILNSTLRCEGTMGGFQNITCEICHLLAIARVDKVQWALDSRIQNRVTDYLFSVGTRVENLASRTEENECIRAPLYEKAESFFPLAKFLRLLREHSHISSVA